MSDPTAALKQLAAKLGFTLAGTCPAAVPTGLTNFHEWLSRGYAGEMNYLADRAAAYADPNLVLSGVRSILVLAMPYRTTEPQAPAPGQGRISRYAWGDRDYHDVIRERLHQLADALRELVPGATARGVADTAPLLERDLARQAGLGWIGKNTLLLNRDQGSWFFLAALLTDAELTYDAPHETDHCGTCRACLDACPTDAFVAPYVLDARRCISYMTIEQHTLPKVELRPGQGDWLFGCDVCQDVCPWNNKTTQATESAFAPLPTNDPIDLVKLLTLDENTFRQKFRHTPLARPGRTGILRSAAIVLGNQRHAPALPALKKLQLDPNDQLKSAATWAIEQITR